LDSIGCGESTDGRLVICSRNQELEKTENERRAEKERQEAIERQARLNCQQQDDERRHKILAKLEEIQRREVKESLKVDHILLLHSYDCLW